ncbi:hypothetical protein PAV_10c00570 [Paenibacillus alvei DSM 29]|uniref:hypothetical protein n=1 Tax=Paenibacillus alvei TaxID=44250 RepID=UPI000288DE83|nr:hypothetical protein [Paenibacillus alvei]EJW14939.1 hypothetical protein PAV_10c00570 [Paenibacillus alvei DSM 29]
MLQGFFFELVPTVTVDVMDFRLALESGGGSAPLYIRVYFHSVMGWDNMLYSFGFIIQKIIFIIKMERARFAIVIGGGDFIFKCGVALLYGAFTHLLLVMFWNDYVYMRTLKDTGTAVNQPFYYINDSFWTMFNIEIGLAVVLIIASFFIKKEPK